MWNKEKKSQKHKVTAQSKVKAMNSWVVLFQESTTLHSNRTVESHTVVLLMMGTQNELNMLICVIHENRYLLTELNREQGVTECLAKHNVEAPL